GKTRSAASRRASAPTWSCWTGSCGCGRSTSRAGGGRRYSLPGASGWAARGAPGLLPVAHRALQPPHGGPADAAAAHVHVRPPPPGNGGTRLDVVVVQTVAHVDVQPQLDRLAGRDAQRLQLAVAGLGSFRLRIAGGLDLDRLYPQPAGAKDLLDPGVDEQR